MDFDDAKSYKNNTAYLEPFYFMFQLLYSIEPLFFPATWIFHIFTCIAWLPPFFQVVKCEYAVRGEIVIHAQVKLCFQVDWIIDSINAKWNT